MNIPKYVLDIMARSEFVLGIGDAGYTIRIHKATPYTQICTFQKEINRFVSWCNRQVPQMEDCPTARINTIPYITHYYDQLAIVTIYDPVMKWLEPYMSYTKRSRA